VCLLQDVFSVNACAVMIFWLFIKSFRVESFGDLYGHLVLSVIN